MRGVFLRSLIGLVSFDRYSGPKCEKDRQQRTRWQPCKLHQYKQQTAADIYVRDNAAAMWKESRRKGMLFAGMSDPEGDDNNNNSHVVVRVLLVLSV